ERPAGEILAMTDDTAALVLGATARGLLGGERGRSRSRFGRLRVRDERRRQHRQRGNRRLAGHHSASNPVAHVALPLDGRQILAAAEGDPMLTLNRAYFWRYTLPVSEHERPHPRGAAAVLSLAARRWGGLHESLAQDLADIAGRRRGLGRSFGLGYRASSGANEPGRLLGSDFPRGCRRAHPGPIDR